MDELIETSLHYNKIFYKYDFVGLSFLLLSLIFWMLTLLAAGAVLATQSISLYFMPLEVVAILLGEKASRETERKLARKHGFDMYRYRVGWFVEQKRIQLYADIKEFGGSYAEYLDYVRRMLSMYKCKLNNDGGLSEELRPRKNRGSELTAWLVALFSLLAAILIAINGGQRQVEFVEYIESSAFIFNLTLSLSVVSILAAVAVGFSKMLSGFGLHLRDLVLVRIGGSHLACLEKYSDDLLMYGNKSRCEVRGQSKKYWMDEIVDRWFDYRLTTHNTPKKHEQDFQS